LALSLRFTIGEHPELRTRVYQLLREGVATPGLALLAQAAAEAPDVEGLLLLIKLETEYKRSFAFWRAIEKVVIERKPSDSWKGAADFVPVPALELRAKLLAMTIDGGAADVAARCLNQIDKMRGEYGTPDSEPRHPDLASGKRWPIMRPDPEADEAA
jgi:hypothetical protein